MVSSNETELRELRRKYAPSQLRYLRDLGSALVIGGSSIALAIMLGGQSLHEEVLIAFLVIFDFILSSALTLAWAITDGLTLIVPRAVWVVGFIGVIACGLPSLVLIFYFVFHREPVHVKFPLPPYSPWWWAAVGILLLVALGGGVIRWSADWMIDTLRL